jgi:glucan phosphoethanolaminetransferase (alkaline phosphatase superfamily)
MLHALDIIAETREARVEDAEIALPGIYWAVVWFAMMVLVLASCAIQRSWFRTFFLACQAGILGALIGVVFISDHPFKGQTTVPTHPLDTVIVAMKQRAS